jgi:hypothetical protein
MRDLKAIDAVKGDVAKVAKTIESLTGLTQREIGHRRKELTQDFEALPTPGPNSSIQNVVSELQRLSEAI